MWLCLITVIASFLFFALAHVSAFTDGRLRVAFYGGNVQVVEYFYPNGVDHRPPAWRAYSVAVRASVPVWILCGFAALLLAIPAAWCCWRVGIRRRRRSTSRCVKCGYLLVGLPEPRCPECGTEFDPCAKRSPRDDQ